jgi:hypothetical protein
VQAITSGARSQNGRSIKRLRTADADDIKPSAHDFGNEARCELDTRADTCCAGRNCRPIFFTGQQWDVQGFHDDFIPVQDVPIATVATAWSDPYTGQCYILIVHEALYFGNKMNHSLINPNQLRHFGVEVYDNPYEMDPTKSMGIVLPDNNYKIPFLSQGSTVFFTSRYPTDDEMHTYPHVVVTCDQQWDPQKLVMPGGLDELGQTTTDRTIQQIRSNISHGANCHHHMYETDCVTHSIDGNTEQLLMERMIESVNISTLRHSEELVSKTRHSKFTPEHVANLFGCNIGMAKDILACTTQAGVRYAVLPLSRRYRVDHIHLHHTYLAGNWTMDHVESKYKSIRGHTGSIVFSNGNIVVAYPTHTKNDNDSTESLRRLTEDLGIPANLKSDMATSFTGQHTDFQ